MSKISLLMLWHFQWTRWRGECDPFGLNLGTCLSYGEMYSRVQAQLISINFYREWKMIANFTFVHDTVMDRMTHPNIFGSLLIETFVEHYYVCELGCAILCCIQNMSRVGWLVSEIDGTDWMPKSPTIFWVNFCVSAFLLPTWIIWVGW
jgi:hypothetical protein